jgi:hypothetical protein
MEGLQKYLLELGKLSNKKESRLSREGAMYSKNHQVEGLFWIWKDG